MRSLLTAITAAVLCVSLVPATAASAEPDLTPQQARQLLSKQATSAAELQRQVKLQLTLYPGGVQTAADEVSYDGGAFVITFANPADARHRAGVMGTADCPTNWFCFYDYTDFGYPRGKLSSCGPQDLSQYGWNDRAESQHNNSWDGVAFFNHIGAFHGYSSISSSDVEVAYGLGLTGWNFDWEDRNIIDHVARWCP